MCYPGLGAWIPVNGDPATSIVPLSRDRIDLACAYCGWSLVVRPHDAMPEKCRSCGAPLKARPQAYLVRAGAIT